MVFDIAHLSKEMVGQDTDVGDQARKFEKNFVKPRRAHGSERNADVIRGRHLHLRPEMLLLFPSLFLFLSLWSQVACTSGKWMEGNCLCINGGSETAPNI